MMKTTSILVQLGLTAFCASVSAAPHQSTSAQPGLIPADATPYGHSYVEWAEMFWQHVLSIPAAQNPALGNSDCTVDQSGPVWFLPAPLGATVGVACTIPPGKALFFPAISFENDYPCPDPNFQPAPGQSLED